MENCNHLRSLRLAVLFVGLAISSSFAQSSVPNPDAWVTNGTVQAITRSGGTTYIGGDFTYVGPHTGFGVPLTAAAGQPVATYPKVNGTVYASIPDGSGGWYIGGSFTQVGTTPRNRIAHILSDGTVDATWNPNANQPVYALAVSDTTVYAGGSFTIINGATTRNRIAALDASTGLATAWNPNASNSVRALAVSGTTVYAAGDFTTIGELTRNYIAALDAAGVPTAWDPNASNSVRALAVSGTTVYAGGDFKSIGGQTRLCIAALDAAGVPTAWNPDANGTVFALAVSGTAVYAVGGFTFIGGEGRSCIAALDATGAATAWNPNANGIVYALAVSGTTVYAGGGFTSIGGQTRNNIAALDASGALTAWNPNADSLVLALAASPTTVYAGGTFTSIGRQTRNNIAALDAAGAATDWDPNANQPVYALAVSGTTVYAGGIFTSIGGGQTRNRIAALDATTGTATPWDPNANNSVRALAVLGTTVYASGDFTTIDGKSRYRIAALDISTGNATLWDPNPNSSVSVLAVSGTTVYAGGTFTNIGGQPRNRIAAFDATGVLTPWNPDADLQVYALAVSGTTVYAGGNFLNIGGRTRNRIAALDASGVATPWDPNASATVYALAVSGTTVYAGGDFSTIGGQTRPLIAALDATVDTINAKTWNPNANSRVLALAASPTTVYAGGYFTTIGGNPQPNYAQFDIPPTPSAPTSPGADSITTTAIRWTWSDQSANETGFKVWADAGSTTPTTLRTTTAADATSWIMPTLQASTQYTFQVAATNQGGDSAKTSNYTAWTLIGAVSGLTFSSVGTGSISVAASNTPSNLAVASSGLYFANTTAATNGGWQQNNTAWASGSLTPNTQYTFSGKSRNGASVETAAAGGSKYTLAAVPVAPTVGNPTVSTLNVAIASGDGNPAATEYAIYCVTASQWVQAGGSLGGSAVWQTAAAWGTKTVTGLNGATPYAFQTRARNGENVETTNGSSGTGSTQCTLTYTAGAHGSINGISPQTVNYATNGTTVTAVANTGYHFVQWSDGSTANPRRETNVTANHSVTASFAIDTFTLTYTAGANGTISGTSPQTVNYATDGTEVTAVPVVGYHFTRWSDSSTANPRTDSNVTTNVSVTASFAINRYHLAYTAGANGSVDGATSQTLSHGASGTTVTAVPAIGYHFVAWSDGSTANPRTDVNVTTNLSVAGTFAINRYHLAYATGANGSIDGATSQTVNHGASGTTVTATPATGYHFVQWSDGVLTATRADANVTADLSVTASFAINWYPVVFLTDDTPGAALDGATSQTVAYGCDCTSVTANAPVGWHFVAWTVLGADFATSNPLTVKNVTEATTLTANFSINRYRLAYAAGANGSVDGATSQTVNHGAGGTEVTAVPAAGYHFVQWSDGILTAARTDTNVTASLNVAATFAINQYTLAYAAGPNGSITGTTPQTVAHGGSGSQVTATPDPGYHFVSWSDGYPTAARTDTNVTAGISVTATFAINTYTLAYAAGANGSITGTTPQTVAHGGNGTQVTAVPATGYHFVAWSDGMLTASRTDTNVMANLSVTASFAINWYAVVFLTDGTPGATLEGATSQTLAHGSDATTVTAIAPVGRHFVAWTVLGADFATSNPLTLRNVTEATTVTATFSINRYHLAYAAGTNGSIDGATSQTVTYAGTGTAVTAVPTVGYHFTQWSDGMLTASRSDTNVMANLSVTASFAINRYHLAYSAGTNGSIDGATSQTVNHGASGTTVTATPVTGYHFAQWSDGSTVNPRTDANVTADVSVTASFAINRYHLAYAAGTNGSVTGATSQTLNHGASGTTVTTVAATGYRFTAWSDSNTSNPRRDLNVTASLSVTANFAANSYMVVFQTDGTAGATLTGTASQTVDYGADCTAVTANAPVGWRFVKWTKGETPYSTNKTLTVTGVTEDMTLTATFAPIPPPPPATWTVF